MTESRLPCSRCGSPLDIGVPGTKVAYYTCGSEGRGPLFQRVTVACNIIASLREEEERAAEAFELLRTVLRDHDSGALPRLTIKRIRALLAAAPPT